MGVCYEPLKKMLGRFVICVVQATAFLAINAVPVAPYVATVPQLSFDESFP